jgi:hypothetical protein
VVERSIRKYFEFFESLGGLFKARFLEPLWGRYPACESDDFAALELFLDGYAFTRQGAKPDYSHAAVEVIKQLRSEGLLLTNKNAPETAWKKFKDEFKEQIRNQKLGERENGGLNEANNPLCSRGEGYQRTYKEGEEKRVKCLVTKKPSILEFLQRNEPETNILKFVKDCIDRDKLADCHSKLREINGIGPKIASLFLRDVAIRYELVPSKERELLQPIDRWVRRISECLSGGKFSSDRAVAVAKWIVDEAEKYSVKPEYVNEGMWYFGSQIAGSEYRLLKMLHDLEYAKGLFKERMEATRQELLVWEQKRKITNSC